MTVQPRLGAVSFTLRDASRPLLVLGAGLGTSVTALWKEAADALCAQFDIIGFDLPGHGVAPPVEPGSLDGLTIADLAAAVLDVIDKAQAERGDTGAPVWYAGVSAAGAIGLQLLLDAPERLAGAALICTAPSFGDPGYWNERADLVQAAGTPTQVAGSAGRWFGPGFLEEQPELTMRLLGSLQLADRFGYAAVCRAVGGFDVRDRLGEIASTRSGRTVLAIAGSADGATPPARLDEVVEALPGARIEVLDGVAHQAPLERPDVVAALLRDLIGGAA